MVPGGLPSDMLRTGYGWTDGRDVYGIIRCVPMIVSFGVGTQQLMQQVMMRPSRAGAGSRCYLVSSKFVRVKVG